MSFKDILKVFKLERELTDDETALLNTLRGMSESERELLAETLGPPVKTKAKSATKRVIEKCAGQLLGNVCDLTRRAAVHKDPRVLGYHEFQPPSSPSKSKRAESLGKAIKSRSGTPSVPRCVACYEIQSHTNHDVENGGHEFTTDLAGRVNAQLAHHEDDNSSSSDDNSEERCTATREGGRTCNLLLDHNVHQMKTAMGYHEFVGTETAVGASGD